MQKYEYWQAISVALVRYRIMRESAGGNRLAMVQQRELSNSDLRLLCSANLGLVDQTAPCRSYRFPYLPSSLFIKPGAALPHLTAAVLRIYSPHSSNHQRKGVVPGAVLSSGEVTNLQELAAGSQSEERPAEQLVVLALKAVDS